MHERNLQEIGDDLAYLRSLAEDGTGGPAVGGGILAAAGMIFGAASFATWIVVSMSTTVSPWAHIGIWISAAALFLLALRAIRSRLCAVPGVNSDRNRAMGGAWAMIGLALAVLWAAFMVAAWRLQTWEIMGLFPSLIFALYGAGWGIAAKIFGVVWIRYIAVGSYASAIATAMLVGEQIQHIVTAGGLLGLAAIPGFVLARAEPERAI